MRRRLARPLLLAALALLVAGCGEEEGSAIPFTDVRAAIAGKDETATAAYLVEALKGKTVRWPGTVTEALLQRGDDYVEEAYLYVDFDADGAHPAADAVLKIGPSDVAKYGKGQPVTVVGIVRELARESGKAQLFRMTLKRVE